MGKSTHLIRIAIDGQKALENALANNYASMGWGLVGDIRGREYPVLRGDLSTTYDKAGRGVSASLSALWHLCHDVRKGDYVVTPCGDKIYIGIVSREYYYSDGSEDPVELRHLIQHTAHRVGVKWFQRVFSRDDLSEDLRASLRAQRTYSNLSSYTEEIRALVEPGATAELISVSLTARVLLNDTTEITISGLPKNLDEANQNALFDAIREIYRK